MEFIQQTEQLPAQQAIGQRGMGAYQVNGHT